MHLILFRNCENVYPVVIEWNFRSHWGVRPWTPDGIYGAETPEGLRGKLRYRGVQHDQCPKAWPWWRLIALYFCRLDTAPPTTGRRLWVYTRWGAGFVDVVIDRRGARR